MRECKVYSFLGNCKAFIWRQCLLRKCGTYTGSFNIGQCALLLPHSGRTLACKLSCLLLWMQYLVAFHIISIHTLPGPNSVALHYHMSLPSTIMLMVRTRDTSVSRCLTLCPQNNVSPYGSLANELSGFCTALAEKSYHKSNINQWSNETTLQESL